MTRYIATLDNENLITKVKRFIVEYLPCGTADLATIAAQFYISTRRLQRHLHQEGTSFTALVDETRSELARQYVQEKDMELSEIALLFGFSELSTLSRSFKRWTGKSPVHYIKNLKL